MAKASLDLGRAVSVERLLEQPKKELLPVLQCLEGWKEIPPQDVEVSQISGAMTNLVYRCRNLRINQYVLARVFGTTGALFEREEEQLIFAAVAHAGLGPKLLASFENGRLEEFLLDQSITAGQMRSRPVMICIAAAMAMFNFTQLTRLPQRGRKTPICWPRLRSWAGSLRGLYTPTELEQLQLGDIETQISELERRLTAAGPTWIGFCHNDTQYGNMLLHRASEETTNATSDAEDLMDTTSSFDEQPSGTLSDADVQLGASPPAFSYFKTFKGSKPAFSVVEGTDTSEGAWQIDRAADVEESQGESPRKHPRGLTYFQPADDDSSSALPQEADPTLSVRFIDYEYAGMNPVALDIANHWCEYAADYHAEQPHKLDYSHFPTEKEQKIFTRAYVLAVVALKRQKEQMGLPKRADSLSHSLAASAAVAGINSLESQCETDSVERIAEKLREAALSYVPISHLLWGTWGLLQARLSNVPSFDFTAYARQRIDQFHKTLPRR